MEIKVSKRILKCRKILRDQLEKIKAPGDWEFLTEQKGLFSLTGLTREQC